MQLLLLIKLLVLLSVANGSPVLIKKLCGNNLAAPVDGGVRFLDGRPLFGPSKTIRGVLVAIAATTAAASVLGFEVAVGVVVASAAMVGDLCSSFLKRRLNYPPSSRATGIDQIPESLLPLIACRYWLPLTVPEILVGVVVFMIGEILLSLVLYRFGIRDRPY
jgi:CDP-diglyceride synthetase